MSDPTEALVPTLPAPWATEERLAIQSEARRFAMEEVLPLANDLDKRKAEIPTELIARIAEQGYFGILIDEAHGGMGLGTFEYCMISEELARAWMSVSSIIARAQGMGTAIGDDRRRDELLRRSATGRWIGAASFSEPEAGSDLAGALDAAAACEHVSTRQWLDASTRRAEA
jgi:alkylation response protein AidB-like acyl-CoA dehydrogenase